MAEPALLLCLPSASTSAPFTPLRSNWIRSLPGNLPSPRTASASGALSCSVPPQVRHPSVPAELISGRLSSSPLQVVARPARQAHLRPPHLLPFASPWLLSLPRTSSPPEPTPALSSADASGCRFAASADLRSLFRSGLRRRQAQAPLASAKPSQAQDWHARSAAAVAPGSGLRFSCASLFRPPDRSFPALRCIPLRRPAPWRSNVPFPRGAQARLRSIPLRSGKERLPHIASLSCLA